MPLFPLISHSHVLPSIMWSKMPFLVRARARPKVSSSPITPMQILVYGLCDSS